MKNPLDLVPNSLISKITFYITLRKKNIAVHCSKFHQKHRDIEFGATGKTTPQMNDPSYNVKLMYEKKQWLQVINHTKIVQWTKEGTENVPPGTG